MRLRTRHLACLILLLSALSGAEGSTLSSGDYTLGGHYITNLLAQEHAAVSAEAARVHHIPAPSAHALPGASRSLLSAAWTMRPPSAHASAVQAATAFRV